MKVSYFAILFFLCFKAMAIEIYPSSQGAIGDGIADDTIAIQKTLTLCSQQNAICRLPKGKFFRITQPLFMWGASQLIGTNSGFIFDVPTEPYLLNFGISSKKTTSANNLQAPFTGVVNSVHFRVASGVGGRILYFWRTRGAKILNNRFEVGSLNYSATSSGNNDNWVGAANCIRENIEISNNQIFATATNSGSEGIGLGNFNGALIKDNTVLGVGDDAVGIHFSKNVRVLNNHLQSTHGRIFVANSTEVEIAYNFHQRIASLGDGKIYPGIALIYVGFEVQKFPVSLTGFYVVPNNINVHDNTLVYPYNSVDQGSAIYMYSVNNGKVMNNHITNHSLNANFKASAVHILPAVETVIQTDGSSVSKIYPVGKIDISSNIADGAKSLNMVMTGNCSSYVGPVTVSANTANAFQFYCLGASVKFDSASNKTN